MFIQSFLKRDSLSSNRKFRILFLIISVSFITFSKIFLGIFLNIGLEDEIKCLNNHQIVYYILTFLFNIF